MLLRLSTATPNIGAGPMEIYGATTNADGTQDVYQRIYLEGGGFTDRFAGKFEFHASHNHIHFDGFAQFHLRAITPGNGVGALVAVGDKISFCLLDVTAYDLGLPGAPSSREYTTCAGFQGISVGWADVYQYNLPDQWIDITDVPNGSYWLEVVVDPDDQLLEANETNNTQRIQITLSSQPLLPPGDVNNDQHVTGSDSLLINQVLVGLRSNTHPIFAAGGYANGDVNQTNGVSGADSLLINQVVVGLRSHVVAKILPNTHSNVVPTFVAIYGLGFPTNETPTITIGEPVNLTLTNVAVIGREHITALVPPGGGLGTGTVRVITASTNGAISFGRFQNQ
jgi:hypothetical protein